MYVSKPAESRVFPVLERAIFDRGIKKKAIAEKLNISTKSLSNKLIGKSTFTWDEICVIQNFFFPDMTKEELLKKNKTA